MIRKDCECNKKLVISGGRCLFITDIEGDRGIYLDSWGNKFFLGDCLSIPMTLSIMGYENSRLWKSEIRRREQDNVI